MSQEFGSPHITHPDTTSSGRLKIAEQEMSDVVLFILDSQNFSLEPSFISCDINSALSKSRMPVPDILGKQRAVEYVAKLFQGTLDESHKDLIVGSFPNNFETKTDTDIIELLNSSPQVGTIQSLLGRVLSVDRITEGSILITYDDLISHAGQILREFVETEAPIVCIFERRITGIIRNDEFLSNPKKKHEMQAATTQMFEIIYGQQYYAKKAYETWQLSAADNIRMQSELPPLPFLTESGFETEPQLVAI